MLCHCSECGEQLYCGFDSECRLRGLCQTSADCANDPSFFHPLCVGTYHCNDSKCAYKCSEGL